MPGWTGTTYDQREQWVAWLDGYGAENFYDAFVASAQGAISTCVQCGHPIVLDIVEGGGIPDWRTRGGDYGCFESPDTDDEGTGGHLPLKDDDGEGV